MHRFIRPHLNLGYGEDLPSGVNDLPQLLAFNAAHNPDFIFGRQLRVGDGLAPRDITFAELQRAVERWSVWLASPETTRGREVGQPYPSPVGVFLGSDVTLFIYMVALLRIGTPVRVSGLRLVGGAYTENGPGPLSFCTTQLCRRYAFAQSHLGIGADSRGKNFARCSRGR